MRTLWGRTARAAGCLVLLAAAATSSACGEESADPQVPEDAIRLAADVPPQEVDGIMLSASFITGDGATINAWTDAEDATEELLVGQSFEVDGRSVELVTTTVDTDADAGADGSDSSAAYVVVTP